MKFEQFNCTVFSLSSILYFREVEYFQFIKITDNNCINIFVSLCECVSVVDSRDRYFFHR